MKAYNEMKDVDMDDIPFVASAIHLKAWLWTGDKKASSYQRRKYSFKFINTRQLILLNKK